MIVVEYLKDLMNEIIQERKSIEGDIRSIDLKIKENDELRKLSSGDSDTNYELFTPRVKNLESKLKLKQLEEEKEVLTRTKKTEEEKLKKYNRKIDEIKAIIQSVSDILPEKEKSQQVSVGEEELYKFHMLEIQENERQRISRELHDDTVQNLTSLVHKTELCSKLVEMDSIRCKLELASMTKILREIITDIRKMIYNLRPMLIDDMGLDVAIERALEKLEIKSSKKIINFELEGESYILPSVVAITILRIIQEACSNALRHANPTLVSVILRYEPEQITVKIIDNGYGFETEKIDKDNTSDNSGFGLAMMRERVYLLSGNMILSSEKGIGTTILVTVPVDREE